MQQTFEVTNKVVSDSIDILNMMLSRHYPKTSVIDVMTFLPDQTDTIKAVSFLTVNKFIRIDESLGNHVSLKSFVLLDDKGQDLKHELIDNLYESKTFGCFMKDENRTYAKCDHLIPDQENCSECRIEDDSQICAYHDTQLNKCEQCLESARKSKQTITKQTADEFIHRLIQAHNKQVYGKHDELLELKKKLEELK